MGAIQAGTQLTMAEADPAYGHTVLAMAGVVTALHSTVPLQVCGTSWQQQKQAQKAHLEVGALDATRSHEAETKQERALA